MRGAEAHACLSAPSYRCGSEGETLHAARRDGPAAALEHAQLHCSGEDPEEARCAQKAQACCSTCACMRIAHFLRPGLMRFLRVVLTDKQSGVVLRAPFLATVLKQVGARYLPCLHPAQCS